jgi:hypothetical protein
MRAAQTYRTDPSAAIDGCEAMRLAIDQPVQPIPRFIEALSIIDERANVEFPRTPQRQAVLRDIGLILSGVELDVHAKS